MRLWASISACALIVSGDRERTLVVLGSFQSVCRVISMQPAETIMVALIVCKANRQFHQYVERFTIMRFSSLRKSSVSAVIAIASLGSSLAPAAVAATTANTTFGVSATVQATCLISATPLAFGTYTGVAATSTSTVSVTCTNTTPYNVSLGAGTATGATVTTRKMTGPASAVLSYAMYSDAARSVNWGQTIASDTVAGTGNGSAQALTVYGSVPASQYVAPGAYSDTITATVTY